MNRRDFLERFLYALTAAILALFGVRGDLTHEEVKRIAKDTARKMAPDIGRVNDILKELFPQRFHSRSPSYG